MRPTLILALVGLFAILPSCLQRGATGDASLVKRFEAVIPLLEGYRVRAYRYESWCRAFEYRRGRFASTNNENCTAILDGHRREFDQTARRDMEVLRDALRGASSDVRFLHELTYDDDGRLIRGIFDCSETKEDHVYIFEPNYSLPDTAPPGKFFRPINADWFFVGRTG